MITGILFILIIFLIGIAVSTILKWLFTDENDIKTTWKWWDQ